MFGSSIFLVFDKPKELRPEFGVIKFASPAFWVVSVWVLYNRAVPASWGWAETAFAGTQLLATATYCIAWKHIRNDSFLFAFNTELPKHIKTNGIYRYVRHPFYTAYMLCYAAIMVFTLNPILLVLGVVLLSTYIWASHIEEAGFLSGELRDSYQAYRRSTRRFVPFVI